jgi:hypothetical protein
VEVKPEGIAMDRESAMVSHPVLRLHPVDETYANGARQLASPADFRFWAV